jgi:hypothetical protein
MLSWLCFAFIGLMMFVMAGLRQTVAFGLIYIGFMCLMDGKRLQFFISIAVAYLFHGTALIFLIAYPIVVCKLKFSKFSILYYLIAIIVSLVAGVTVLTYVIDFIGQSDDRFLGYGENLYGSNYTYLIQQVLLVIPALYFLRHRYNERTVAVFAHLSMIALVAISLSPVIAEMFRVSMYFSWALMILFPMAINEASKSMSGITSIVVVLMLLYLILINGSLLNEYYFWFEDTSSYIRKTFTWYQYL